MEENKDFNYTGKQEWTLKLDKNISAIRENKHPERVLVFKGMYFDHLVSYEIFSKEINLWEEVPVPTSCQCDITGAQCGECKEETKLRPYKNLNEIIQQLEWCKYETQESVLEMNTAFIVLKELATKIGDIPFELLLSQESMNINKEIQKLDIKDGDILVLRDFGMFQAQHLQKMLLRNASKKVFVIDLPKMADITVLSDEDLDKIGLKRKDIEKPATPTKGMTVNFNNLRLQAVRAYEGLVKELNNSIKFIGKVIAEPEDIQKDMDDLRMTLGAIACTFNEDDPDFKDLSDEIGETTVFNPQEEEG